MNRMSIVFFASLVTACLPTTASAQNYPSKTVRLIVTVAPGGGLDPQARLLGKKLQESTGQIFVVERHRLRAGVKPLETKVHRVRASFDGREQLRFATGRTHQFGFTHHSRHILKSTPRTTRVTVTLGSRRIWSVARETRVPQGLLL